MSSYHHSKAKILEIIGKDYPKKGGKELKFKLLEYYFRIYIERKDGKQ